MTQNFDYSAKALSAEDQEREDYLNEVSQQSTQFGCGRWHYEATFEDNEE